MPLATYLLMVMALFPLLINYTFVSHGLVRDFGHPGVLGCFKLSFATLERCTCFDRTGYGTRKPQKAKAEQATKISNTFNTPS